MKIQNLTKGQVLKNYKVLCSVLEVKEKGGDSKKAQLKKLKEYVEYHNEGQKFIIDDIYEVAKDMKTRSDRGITRDEYNTIKEQYKPLIYTVLLTKPNFSYTATFNNWLEETNLVNADFIKERKRMQDEGLYNDFTKDFISVEGDSLRKCFISALDSMSRSKKGGDISWVKKKVAINLCGQHIELEKEETTEIINIEKNLCKSFDVKSRNELIFKSRNKLRMFDSMFREILINRYEYSTCYTVYQVVANVGVKEEDIKKNIEKAKKLYGITDDIQKVITDCKDKIYENRFKRATNRYEKIVTNLKDTWFTTEETIKDLELERDAKLSNWDKNYRRYIHNKK